jgi:hypothetical protein
VRHYLKEKCWIWWLTTVIPGIAGTLKEEYHGPGWLEQTYLSQKQPQQKGMETLFSW